MLHRRHVTLALLTGSPFVIDTAAADASEPSLASYYDRHLALEGGFVWGWTGAGNPRRLRGGVRQVGVGQDADFALLDDGTLVTWRDKPLQPSVLMARVASFAAGQSGWFAIDTGDALWHGSGTAAPRRVAEGVTAACIGDSADYFVDTAGRLHVHGLAHRGQYGDGLLTATPGFVVTAQDVVAVKAHTGHAIHLRRDGVVMGTGGNRFGPLSHHGLGDKADRWGAIFDGAVAIATGSRHSLAVRADGSLWAWGEGFDTAPRRLRDGIVAVAAGDTATIARSADGALWQWDRGVGPRALALR
jgi:Regulator of chromosome condensation (RCC1) repeat